MYTLYFYENEAEDPCSAEELVRAWESLNAELNETAQFYWCGSCTTDSGANITLDIGNVPIEQGEEKQYENWRQLPLYWHIPLNGPHWFCVEALALLEIFCQEHPFIKILDPEDLGEDEGPVELDRMRCLASWEQQQLAFLSSRTDVWRMPRMNSIATWRYRRQREEAELLYPAYQWPDLHVMLHGQEVVRCILWTNAERHLALPPCDYIICQREDEAAVLTTDELMKIAGTPRELDNGAGAIGITPNEELSTYFNNAKSLAITDFKMLVDLDWID